MIANANRDPKKRGSSSPVTFIPTPANGNAGFL